jgi:hypothetical protein
MVARRQADSNDVRCIVGREQAWKKVGFRAIPRLACDGISDRTTGFAGRHRPRVFRQCRLPAPPAA